MLAILTGAAAGATESVIVTPFELVKIRLQDKSSTFKGPADVIRQSFKTSGPLG
jgi:solute carrier family 25 2-oxodicarboxylate transporter 21